MGAKTGIAKVVAWTVVILVASIIFLAFAGFVAVSF